MLRPCLICNYSLQSLVHLAGFICYTLDGGLNYESICRKRPKADKMFVTKLYFLLKIIVWLDFFSFNYLKCYDYGNVPQSCNVLIL